jgi:predicted glycosyltransferase
MIFNSSIVLKAVKKEKQIVEEIVEKENIIGIISDSRFGVRSKKVPSVYITHQINVLSGNTTFLTSKIHQKIIAKFDVCWVPDHKGEDSLAGELSHSSNKKLKLKYIGPLSRFEHTIPSKEEMINVKKHDVMVILSGPEPQRGLLEIKLINAFKTFSKKVLFVRGIISEKGNPTKAISIENKNIEIVNFMFQDELKKAVLESKIIISRSGYSTVMDLDKLGAKAFFIPTPGQFEQKFLANYLNEKNIAPFSKQKDFKLKMLENVQNYVGFTHKKTSKTIEDQFPFDVFH